MWSNKRHNPIYKHGKRRTNADKRKAVKTLLEDKEWSGWNNRKIARECAVSHTMVNNMRGSLETDSSEKRKYTDKHGNESVMDTSNIGNHSEKSNEDSGSVFDRLHGRNDKPKYG